jgi:DNA-binding transcriptional LysR family regulator
MHVTWDDLQTIEALVRTGTVMGAAKELGLRHSSISRRVDALEQRLGAPLFLRGARLKATPLALKVSERALRMASEARAIAALLQDERRDRARLVAVTTNDVLAPLLFGALGRCALSQSVRVSVSDAELDLAPGSTDLALRPGAHPSAALRGWRLGRLRVGVYAAKRARDAWVHPAPGLRARASMRWWKAVPPLTAGGVECDTLLAMHEACVAGLGRAALPAVLAERHAQLHLVRELDAGPPLWLLTSATRGKDHALHDVAAQLAAAVREEPGIAVR